MIRSWILAGVFAGAALAQTRAPEFEVATVKPVSGLTGGSSMRINQCTGGPGSRDPLRYTCHALTMKTLIEQAYGVKSNQITGPAWMDSERFEIVARVPDGATREQLRPMLQKLLTERFQMTVRQETRTLQM